MGRRSDRQPRRRQVKHDLRERFLAHILELGPAYTRGERSGELVNTAVQGIESLEAYFSQYLPQLALTVLVPVTFLVLVFRSTSSPASCCC